MQFFLWATKDEGSNDTMEKSMFSFYLYFFGKNLATIMIKFDTDLFFFFLSCKTIQRSNFSALSYWIIRGPLTRSKMPVCVKKQILKVEIRRWTSNIQRLCDRSNTRSKQAKSTTPSRKIQDYSDISSPFPILLPEACRKEPRISLPGQSFLGADVQTFVESPALPSILIRHQIISRIPTARILSL